MKLEAITVSVGYADFLAETIPLNQQHFDRWVIVTAPEDLDTQRVCRYYGVPHVQTDVFRSRWGEFHKAKGINKGLAALALDGWVLHLDADIVLPPRTRELLERKTLIKEHLYGADRFLVRSAHDWRRHQALPAMQHDDYHVNLNMFELAPRFSGERMGGWAPPGFFQLWHPQASGVSDYPAEHSDASRTDVLHTARWGSQSRVLLGELAVYHLESEPAAQGANWGGRVTARWGAQPVLDEHHPSRHRRPPAHRDHHHHDGHWHHRHHDPDPDPYGPGPDCDPPDTALADPSTPPQAARVGEPAPARAQRVARAASVLLTVVALVAALVAALAWPTMLVAVLVAPAAAVAAAGLATAILLTSAHSASRRPRHHHRHRHPYGPGPDCD